MATQTGFWGEAIEGRCQALHLDSQVTKAAKLIGQALDLGLISLQDAGAVHTMSNCQQLEGWLCALAADVALANGEMVAGGVL
jgi:hypothetical protein